LRDIDAAIPVLTAAQRRTGQDQEIDFKEWLVLRVTSHEARIYARDPDEATLATLEDSGRNFAVVWS
jgi:hypothetical protein